MKSNGDDVQGSFRCVERAASKPPSLRVGMRLCEQGVGPSIDARGHSWLKDALVQVQVCYFDTAILVYEAASAGRV